jgi:arylsulfatase A-like enzyme
MKLNKLFFVGIVFFAIQSLSSQEKPNVIVILADDIGLGDVSYYRKKHSGNIVLRTPALDKIAKEGMVFTDAHSPAALCAPTRYAILTGNHCYRSRAPWGVWSSYDESPIKRNDLTLGKLMQKAGYRTSFFGKWGFGMDFLRNDKPNTLYRGSHHKIELNVDITKIADRGPQQNGFDYSLTYPSGIQDVPYAVYENGVMMPLNKDSEIIEITKKDMIKKGVKLDKMEGLGDSYWDPHNAGPLLVNKAIDFIEESTKKEKPFFMYYCSQAVHKPHTPSKKLNGKKIAGTTPSNHLDMVKELDVQMGMLMQTLKKEGVYDNTLFIFTSDNGGLQIKQTIGSGHRSSDIYRGGKNQPYEGGTRVPFIAWWPGKIKSKSVSDEPILGIDVMATLADLTNQKIAKNEAMDSSSLLPLLLGNKKHKVHDFLLTQSGTGKHVMITKDGWKLIIKLDRKDKTDSKRTPFELYNLNENPTEKKSENLIHAPKYREKVKELFNTYNTTRNSKLRTS